jgi:hypothetical protein
LAAQREHNYADGISRHAEYGVIGRNDTVGVGKQLFRILQGRVA